MSYVRKKLAGWFNEFSRAVWVCIMVKTSQSLFKIWFHCYGHTHTDTHTDTHTYTHTQITAVPFRLNRMLAKLLTTKSSQDEETQAYISRMFGPSPHLPRLSSPVVFLFSLCREAQLPADNRLNGSQLLYNCVSQKPSWEIFFLENKL